MFLNAPEILQPTLFMVGVQGARTNKRNLELGYVSEIKWTFLPEICSTNCVDFLAAKKWERERFLESKLEHKSKENTRAKFVRVWEWRSEHGCFTLLSRPLFKEQMAGHVVGRHHTTARSRLKKVGPRGHLGWVNRPMGSAEPWLGPLVLPFGPELHNGYLEIMPGCSGQTLLEKMFKWIFFKGIWCSKNIFEILQKWKKC